MPNQADERPLKKEEIAEQPGAAPQEVLETEKEAVEKTEESLAQEADQHQLRESIEAMAIDDDAKQQAGQAAQSMQAAGQEEKLNKLLLIAKEKGVVFAVQVAKKMNDPYLLDMLHDKLSAQGLYKNFKK